MQKIKAINQVLIMTFAFFQILSCTTEESKMSFSVVVENQSSEPLNISLFYDDFGVKTLFVEQLLNPLETYNCSYSKEIFTGFHGCLNSNSRGIDSISIVFSNSKGYICVDNSADQALCLLKGPSLFGGAEAFQSLGDNNYKITITQDDFENAFELP